MKHIIYSAIVLLSLFISSCEEEIGELTSNDAQRMVLNGILTTADSNDITLSMSGINRATKVTGAEVSIYINGSLAETITSNTDTYHVNSTFHEGDKVDVVAISDSLHCQVSSSCTVLPAVEITDIREAESTVKYSEYYHYNRFFVDLLKHTSGKTYYRLVVETERKYIYSTGQESEPRKDHKYSFRNDLALNDGTIKTYNEEDIAIIDIVDQYHNSYGLFTSDFFTNDRYTLTIDVEAYYYSSRTVTFKVYSISHDEYLYLKGLSNVQQYEAGILTSPNPPVVKGNIKNGYGIFSISSAAVKSKTSNMYDDSYYYPADTTNYVNEDFEYDFDNTNEYYNEYYE